MVNKILSLCLLLIISVIGLDVYQNNQASAAAARDWKAGRIIDDAVFTNKNDMTVGEIQNFLNNKVPNCDTWGTKTSEFGGGTRAQYGASKGNPAPFTCLKDYYEVPKTSPGPGVPASNYGGAPIPNGARSAAQLIWDAAQRYNINPKVLLVTIQKESAGPLTTDEWPFRKQYTYAMGAHCPDSGPNGSANCDENYAGFSLQISESAELFRWYLDSMSQPWWSYKKPGNNSVLYHPNGGCGSSNIYIETKATAALYTYTPYQPNQAALNNMYGTGDGCSSYGNRNFWRIYTDWFGTTTGINGHIQLSKGITISRQEGMYENDTVTVSYEIKNLGSQDDYIGGVGVCGTINGQWYDLGFTHHKYIPAYGNVTVSHSKKLDKPGFLYVYLCSYHPMLGWAGLTYPYDNTGSMPRAGSLWVLPNPRVTSGINLSPANPAIGEPVTGNMTIHNYSSSPMNIGSMVIGGRTWWGGMADFPIVNDVIIPAGGDYTYSQTKKFTSGGAHNLFIANWNGVWSKEVPISADNSIARQRSINVTENPLVSTGLSLSGNPASGQPITATLTITNTGSAPINIGSMVVAGRGNWGGNGDFPIVNDVIVPANSTYTYSQTRSFTPGTYTFFIANWNGVWSKEYPKSMNGSIVRQSSMTIN